MKNTILVEEEVRKFYSNLKFPGPYSLADLEFYDESICNRYLKKFDDAVSNSVNVLDIGCGSGFIVNFLARRNESVNFDAVDFSESIEYAQSFATQHGIGNVKFLKEDFLKFDSDKKYDLIIANGVLHHIPRYGDAIIKAFSLLKDDGKLIAGIYNCYGKVLKRFVNVDYATDILRQDQECVPYEVAWSNSEFIDLLPKKVEVESVFPSVNNHFVDLCNVFNHKNGGLTIYTLTKNKKLL